MQIEADQMLALLEGMRVSIEHAEREVRRAMEQAGDGPEIVTTTWCAAHLGYTSRQWRAWCAEGVIRGAQRDTSGRWRLPSRAVRKHFAEVLKSGTVTPAPEAASPKRERRRTVRDPRVTPIDRRARRGGRTTTAAGGAS